MVSTCGSNCRNRREMVRGELYITAPSLFRCPISMDVMRSPVSLCTGVTYDRSSIKLWLDSGHDTCPATMQILPSKDFVPNLTLRRLINLWAQSNGPLSPSPSPRTVSEHQVKALLCQLGNREEDEKIAASLSDIAELARSSDENRRYLASFDGFSSAIVAVLVGESAKTEVLEPAVVILDSISIGDRQIHSPISKRIQSFLSKILLILKNGKLESKISSARVLKQIAADEELKRAISDNNEILGELVEFLGCDSSQSLNDAVLWALNSIAATRATKVKLVESGIVARITAILGDGRSPRAVVEKAMKVLAAVASCAEGRSAVRSSDCGGAVVERLVKVSMAATEDGVAVLWSAWCVGGDRRAREAVAGGHGVAKILLAMQSGCGDRARRMCADLLRLMRPDSDGSYESRTTHVMHS